MSIYTATRGGSGDPNRRTGHISKETGLDSFIEIMEAVTLNHLFMLNGTIVWIDSERPIGEDPIIPINHTTRLYRIARKFISFGIEPPAKWLRLVYDGLPEVLDPLSYTFHGSLPGMTETGYHQLEVPWQTDLVGVFIINPDGDAAPSKHFGDDPAKALDWLLDDYLSTFPLSTEQDQWAAVAEVLTIYARPVLPIVPLFFNYGHGHNSGKTFLAQVLGQLAIPNQLKLITKRNAMNELMKQIEGLMIRGTRAILVDNYPRGASLDHGGLQAILTGGTMDTRVIGTSRMVTTKTAALVFTGNKVEVSDDTLSRTAMVDFTHSTRTGGEPLVQASLPEEQEKFREFAYLVLSLGALGPDYTEQPVTSRMAHWEQVVFHPLCAIKQDRLPEPENPLTRTPARVQDQEHERAFLMLCLAQACVPEENKPARLADIIRTLKADGRRLNDELNPCDILEIFAQRWGTKPREVKKWTDSVWARVLQKMTGEVIGGYQLRRKTPKNKVVYDVLKIIDGVPQEEFDPAADLAQLNVGEPDQDPEQDHDQTSDR